LSLKHSPEMKLRCIVYLTRIYYKEGLVEKDEVYFTRGFVL